MGHHVSVEDSLLGWGVVMVWTCCAGSLEEVVFVVSVPLTHGVRVPVVLTVVRVEQIVARSNFSFWSELVGHWLAGVSWLYCFLKVQINVG